MFLNIKRYPGWAGVVQAFNLTAREAEVEAGKSQNSRPAWNT